MTVTLQISNKLLCEKNHYAKQELVLKQETIYFHDDLQMVDSDIRHDFLLWFFDCKQPIPVTTN